MTSLNNKADFVRCDATDAKIKDAFDILVANQCDTSIPEVYEAYSFLYACLFYQVADLTNKQRSTNFIEVRDVTLIEDAFQEAFLKLINILTENNFRDWTKLRSWLNKTIKYQIFDWIYFKRTTKFEDDSTETIYVDKAFTNADDDINIGLERMDDDEFSPFISPVEYSNRLYRKDVAKTVLAHPRLNKRDKTILKLRLLATKKDSQGRDRQLTFADIAKRLGINENTVKTNYNAAKEKMHGVCDELGIDANMLFGK